MIFFTCIYGFVFIIDKYIVYILSDVVNIMLTHISRTVKSVFFHLHVCYYEFYYSVVLYINYLHTHTYIDAHILITYRLNCIILFFPYLCLCSLFSFPLQLPF